MLASRRCLALAALITSASAGAGTGCGTGVPATPDAATVDTRTPHLAASAVAELQSIGVDKFVGHARITSETTTPDPAGTITSVTFDPTSGPVCIFGVPYEAHLLTTTAASDKLLIFLGGGGACWTGFCHATPLPDDGIIPLGPLHVEVASNPFFGFNVLYLPYCDGSVFSGSNDVPDPDGDRHYHGRENLTAAYDLLSRLGDMKTVVVGGVSAGAYGALYATVMARLRYPKADMFVYDDSGPWIQNLARTADVEARIADWHFNDIFPPSCTACAGGHGQLIGMMDWLLAHDDQLRVGMFSYYRDSVIGDEFNKLVGNDYKVLLLAETGKLRSAWPTRVARFMLDGTSHVLSLYWPDSVKVNGTSMRDFTSVLLNGDLSQEDLLGP